jgi:hypothetical protein
MPSARIFEIPFCFKVIGIKHRHRNTTEFLLKDSVPVQVAVLSADEAPVRLRARLKAEGRGSPSSDIALRHDGESYLRAINHMPKDPGAAGLPFTAADFEQMLAWTDTPFPAVYGETDKPIGILTLTSPELRGWHGMQRLQRRPDDLEKLEVITPLIRDWIENGRDAARARAVRAGDEFVLVDGHLHRRVGAPVAVLTENGFPYFCHSDQVKEVEKFGLTSNWMPIAYADAIPALSSHANASAFECEIDGPLERDDRANLAFVAAWMLPRCTQHLALAVADMTAEGMAAYRAFRENYPAAVASDLDAGLVAVEALRTMAMAPSFSEAEATLAMRRLIIPKLAFFDAMARRSGLITSPADEEAMLALAS